MQFNERSKLVTVNSSRAKKNTTLNSSQTRIKWQWTRHRKFHVTSSPCDEFTGYLSNCV